MSTLTIFTRIANACAVLLRKHGEVTQQALRAGCSRQTLYNHAQQVQQDLAEASLPGPSKTELAQQLQQLQLENQQLWDWLGATFDCSTQKQQQFATTACAMGLSLTQTLTLLAVLLPKSLLPSRAKLGRWVLEQAKKASRFLTFLDRAVQHLVLCLALDEIFFRRQPVLMAVEPVSFAWVMGQRTQDRSAATWSKQLQAWPHFKEVLADGGSGIEKGLALTAQHRQEQAEQTGQEAQGFVVQLDLFHFRRDGQRALRLEWAKATEVWEEAEKAERMQQRYGGTGKDRRRLNGKVKPLWAKAEAALEAVCAKERAWKRVVAALGRFRPDGSLNETSWARGELEAAAVELTGSRWKKVLNQMQDPRLLAFLGVLAQKLEQIEPDVERRELLIALWRLSRAKRKGQGETQEACDRGLRMLRRWLANRLGENWKESYARVREAFGRTHRASSCVECVNSVVRMHQSRHKNLTQELLDLKRLYWNLHKFREGKRKGHSPYELLGLALPSSDPWVLLQLDPEQLTQHMSNQEVAA